MKARQLMRAGSVAALLALGATSGQAQMMVLEPAGQGNAAAAPGSPRCGRQPISIARMNWPSASLLAEIHARLLDTAFGCDVEIVPGDLAASASSMAVSGQPQIVPEMWVSRVSDVWNEALEAQMARSAAPTYETAQFEGWFMPSYMAGLFNGIPQSAGLAAALPQLQQGVRTRFISCPSDWACAVINRNLVRAQGLSGLVEVVEPANRFEMDRLIAEAVNRREMFLFYYWQPNAVLAQLDFTALDMGAYDEEAARCLAELSCATPRPSAFAQDSVVIALADKVFTELPAVAAYFQRASLPIAEMDALMAQLNLPGATISSVAEGFVAQRADLWTEWVGTSP